MGDQIPLPEGALLMGDMCWLIVMYLLMFTCCCTWQMNAFATVRVT